MRDEPVVPSPLYGLRTWSVVGGSGGERLASTQTSVVWPGGGEWLEAACEFGHDAPGRDCDCGVHAWHPRPRSARRVLASRRNVAGVVEASGAIELYEDGFRAQRGRPYALVLAPGRNPQLLRRLGESYRVPLVDARRADDLVEWCRERGVGLDEAVVADLLGEAALDERRRARRSRRRALALRTAVALAVVALMLAIGLVATDDPGDRALSGRTGEFHQQQH